MDEWILHPSLTHLMAPALPVYSREEIQRVYPKIFKKEELKGRMSPHINREDVPENCKLYELVQNQCTYDGNTVFCLPFKRVFLRCLESQDREVIGYKLTPLHKNSSSSARGRFDVRNTDADGRCYRDIEITVEGDNEYEYGEGVKEFLRAESVLRKKMKEYYDKQKS